MSLGTALSGSKVGFEYFALVRSPCSIGRKGSFETFAASRLNVGNGVKGRLCADVLVIPIM